ncbi:MAG: xanthine dehydrogenase family protein subunit M [Actinobacteria bacterium]|nr:xanthine dehydrogenase family protein subunit M [Actinomycetota bacterium]
MKPASFVYHRPTDLGDALAALAEVGHDGKVLAGGQSLVPVLTMRLAAPGHLVDINRLAELRHVTVTGDAVRVGALARHTDLERDEPAYAVLPLLRRATAHVAHRTIRNRGTTVGSLVHADPAAELPAVLAVLAGEVELVRAGGGRRLVPAGEFFLGPLESAVRPGELAVSATFPVPPAGTGSAWLELSRRRGDYALVGVGVLVTLDAEQRVTRVRAGYVSVGPTPIVLDLTDAVAGQRYDEAAWAAAGALAATLVHPEEDIHATAAYRRHLVAVLTSRAAQRAGADAAGTGAGTEGAE